MNALKPNRIGAATADAFLHHHREPAPASPAGPASPADDAVWDDRFARLLRGAALTEAVTALAMAGPCCAAALRVIPGAGAGDPVPAEPALSVAGVIDRLCRENSGSWGRWPDGTLCCALPGIDPAQAAHLLEPMPAILSRQCPGVTVVCGIAGHPLLDYGPADLVLNALKALRHASFFEGGAMIRLDAVSLNISGDRAFEAGDISAAMAEYQNALALDGANVNVLNSLGACFGQLGAYEKSLRCFEAAVAADPGEYMAVYNIGLARQLMGDPGGALTQFSAAAAMAPEVFEIAFQLGRGLLDAGRPAEALTHLETAVRLNPGSGSAQKALGLCHEGLNHLEPAIAAFKRAVTLNPNDPESLSSLGWLFDKKGENPEITMIFCQQSVDLAPESGLYRLRLGRLYLKQGMLAEALETFKAAEGCGTDAAALIEEVLERLDRSKPHAPN